MEKIDFQELKNRLFELKKLYIESESQKVKKNSTINSEIIYFTKSLIEDFKLENYDQGIKMESHKTKFFINDVESIIFKNEK